MKKIVIIVLLTTFRVAAQPADESVNQIDNIEKMDWFKKAKLGIFIHWGIYSVNGISESWSFYNNYISHEDYIKQTNGFTASNYDPNYWANLIKESGAKYSVITAKHHDGFALWDTQFGAFNAVKHSSAKQDLISPFVEALRQNDLKVGVYYSLPDWSYPDYTDFTRKNKRYEIANDPKRWEKFLAYYQNQLKELRDNFNPDLWWFDGDWEHSADEWEVAKICEMLQTKNPNVIFNSRLAGNGDYETPEIGLPIFKPDSEFWELCMTINDSWGYQGNDKNYKSAHQILDIFVHCLSKGGNLLLDIAPKADGTIPKEQEDILKTLGGWINKHEQAVYETSSGIPYEYYQGPTTLSADSSILYLYVRDQPKDGKILLKGIKNKVNRIYVVGNGTILKHQLYCKPYWSSYPGLNYIDLPLDLMDEYYTVIAVVLDGKVDLYEEKSKAIESN